MNESTTELLKKITSNESDLFRRKGKLIIPTKLILGADENTLREIFTNFFPIDANRFHESHFWDSITYFGVSPHFEIAEEACVAPEYEVILTEVDGVLKFDRFQVTCKFIPAPVTNNPINQ